MATDAGPPAATRPLTSAPPAPIGAARTAHMALLALLLMLGYGLANAAAQSLFVAAHGSAALPTVWLAVALLCAPVVAAVNALAARRPMGQVCVVATLGAAAVLLVLLLARARGLGGTAFCLYVWKDVYIVVLVELFWTFANVAFAAPQARAAYGWFCAAGSAGSIIGSLVLVPLAPAAGTTAALWLTLPLLALNAWGAYLLGRSWPLPAPATLRARPLEGFAVLRRSRTLWRLMALVATVQVVVTLMDFQFNIVFTAAYPDTDLRTAVLGRVFAAINGVALLLQLATPYLLRHLGMARLLLAMPLALAATVMAHLLQPTVLAMGSIKVVGKAADYSLLRAIKEMLYIPLSYAEKTQGKAVVDMLTYRVAKAGASLLLLALAGHAATAALSVANLGLCGVWLGLSVAVARYDARR